MHTLQAFYLVALAPWVTQLPSLVYVSPSIFIYSWFISHNLYGKQNHMLIVNSTTLNKLIPSFLRPYSAIHLPVPLVTSWGLFACNFLSKHEASKLSGISNALRVVARYGKLKWIEYSFNTNWYAYNYCAKFVNINFVN